MFCRFRMVSGYWSRGGGVNSCTRVSVLGFLVASGWLELVLLLLLKLGLVRRGLNSLYYTTFWVPLKGARVKMAHAWGVADRCSWKHIFLLGFRYMRFSKACLGEWIPSGFRGPHDGKMGRSPYSDWLIIWHAMPLWGQRILKQSAHSAGPIFYTFIHGGWIYFRGCVVDSQWL